MRRAGGAGPSCGWRSLRVGMARRCTHGDGVDACLSSPAQLPGERAPPLSLHLHLSPVLARARCCAATPSLLMQAICRFSFAARQTQQRYSARARRTRSASRWRRARALRRDLSAAARRPLTHWWGRRAASEYPRRCLYFSIEVESCTEGAPTPPAPSMLPLLSLACSSMLAPDAADSISPPLEQAHLRGPAGHCIPACSHAHSPPHTPQPHRTRDSSEILYISTLQYSRSPHAQLDLYSL